MSEKKKEPITDKKISRRSLLKWSAGLAAAGVIGLGAGYGASDLLRPLPQTVTQTMTETNYLTVEKEQVFVNCCHNGPVSVRVRNGAITRIDPLLVPNWKDIPTWQISARGKTYRPTTSKSFMNSWAQAYRRFVYSSARLLYPMKRVGYTPGGKGDISNRGKGEFVRISWDEATTLITSEMERLRTTYGLGSVLLAGTAHYQTRGAFTDGMADTINRFLGLYAKKGPTPPPYPDAANHLPHGPNWNHSWIGWASAPDLMYGYYWQANQIWSPSDLIEDVLKNSNLVVYWAMDPTSTSQMYHGYEREEVRQWISDVGIKTISIAPTLNETAAFFHADKWIPVYPGYDIPLAIAITYVWFTENTWAKDWVASHATGVTQYQDYVLGKTDGVPKTPEWAEKFCGVKARDIRALARLWASGPVLLYCHVSGANRGWNGDDWARMMTTLQILQGNIGRPGGNLNSLESWYGVPAEPADPDVTAKLPARGRAGIGPVLPADPYPIHRHPQYTVWAKSIYDPPVTWTGGTTGSVKYWNEFTMKHMYPYPGVSQVRMLCQITAGGFMTEAAWLEDKARALMSPNLETSFVATIFQTEPLCKYADILLPICTNLERVDITSFTTKWVVYMQKCVEPLGESKSDLALLYELAKKLGFGDQMYNGMTEEEIVKAIYNWSSIPSMGVSWQDFHDKGYALIPFMNMDKYTRNTAMKWYYDQPKGSGLTTPSGMLEIYSKPMADAVGEDGNGFIAPIPKWYEPKDGKSSPLASKYPLISVIRHLKYRLHSQFDQVTWIRELCKMKVGDKEYEPIWIHPQDAQARGIKHGDVVRVFNDLGEMLRAAYLTERVMPGVIGNTYGSWSDPVDPRKQSLDRAGNANTLLSVKDYKNWNQQINVNHSMIQIEKWTGG